MSVHWSQIIILKETVHLFIAESQLICDLRTSLGESDWISLLINIHCSLYYFAGPTALDKYYIENMIMNYD